MKAYLEFADITLMEQAANTERDRLMIRLLSRLGCRVSELLALRGRDIDFEQRTLTILHLKRRVSVSCPDCLSRLSVRHQFCPVCGKKIGDTIKGQQERRRIRVLPIDQESIDMLKQYLSHNGSYAGSNELLFNISRHRAWQIVRDCARKVGLPSLINPETGRTRGVSPH